MNEAISVVDRMGLSLDCWLYHTQLEEVAQLADTHPELTIILNHVGSPILGGPYRGKNDEVFAEWHAAILRVSERQNVYVKQLRGRSNPAAKLRRGGYCLAPLDGNLY